MIQSRPIFPFTHTWCAYIYSQTLPLLLENFRKFGNFRGKCKFGNFRGKLRGTDIFLQFHSLLEKGGKKTRQISTPPSVMCLTERRKKKTAKEEKEKRREEKKKKEAAGTEEREPIIEGGIDSGFLLKWGCDAVAA